MERGGRVMKTCGTFGQSSSSSSLRTQITHLDSTPRSRGERCERQAMRKTLAVARLETVLQRRAFGAPEPP